MNRKHSLHGKRMDRRDILHSRKAQFFSLIVFVILLVIIILFSIKANLLRTEDNFNINRLEKTTMNNYVKDFDQIYVEEIVRTSLKPSVASALSDSAPVSKIELLRIMNGTNILYMDPTLTIPSNTKKVLGTLVFSLDNPGNILNVSLEKIVQTAPDTLVFTFRADYRFEFHGNVWERKGKQIIIPMDIYSLKHPGFGYKYVESNWVEDSDTATCFSTQAFGNDAEPCLGYNMKPPYVIDVNS